MNEELKTNHNIRIVTLATSERVLCMFGNVTDDTEEKKVVGYRMVYPYLLSMGAVNEDGTVPINYARWCPYSPIEDHRISGEHIISVVYPCLLYTSPSPRDKRQSRMPSSA